MLLKAELEKLGTPKGLPNPVKLFDTILDQGSTVIMCEIALASEFRPQFAPARFPPAVFLPGLATYRHAGNPLHPTNRPYPLLPPPRRAPRGPFLPRPRRRPLAGPPPSPASAGAVVAAPRIFGPPATAA